MIDWYFTKAEKPSDDYVDKFSDSKFTTDKWNSFAREIIQNSLDVHNDDLGDEIPVKVKFSLEYFSLEEIPGGKRILEILKHCLENKELNHQTKNKYEHGIEILESERIGCLKISDYNTLGVETGRDKSWGALVYDEGVSRKRRPGKAAGSHGVGKKVPFIISGVNTVYYSTKNESDQLFEGKTSLIYWTENEITYDYEGWLGVIDNETTDRRKKVLPYVNNDNTLDVNDFFVRKESRGTDVIIIGISLDENDFKEAKSKIVNAVLENFFVAIQTKKLICDIFDIKIDSSNLADSIEKYYVSNAKNFQKVKEYSNIVNGNLKDYYRVYCDDPHIIPIIYEGINYGTAEVYFDLGNEKNKKYYCIVREHGMKIKDVQLVTDQSFSAVVLIKDNPDSKMENERINNILSSRENAAHDDFIIDDENIPCDDKTKAIISMLYSEIEKYIKSETEIPVLDETPLDSLSDMLSIQGSLSKGSVRRNDAKTHHKTRKGKKKTTGKRAKNYEEGTSGAGGLEEKDKKKGQGENKPAKEGNEFKATLFENFEIYPQFFRIKDYYEIKFIAKSDVEKARIKIQVMSVDGKITEIDDIVDSAYFGDKPVQVKGNLIEGFGFTKNRMTKLKIKLKPGLDYSPDCDVFVLEGEENA